jgi:hypothetical protein
MTVTFENYRRSRARPLRRWPVTFWSTVLLAFLCLVVSAFAPMMTFPALLICILPLTVVADLIIHHRLTARFGRSLYEGAVYAVQTNCKRD